MYKMALLSFGRTPLPSRHLRLMTISSQKNFEPSCLSSYLSHRRFETSAAMHTRFSLLLGPCRRIRDQNTTLFPYDGHGQFSSLPANKINTGLLESTSLHKVFAASYQTSTNHNQVVNDENNPIAPDEQGWFRRHRTQLRKAPMPALILGFSGLIPFMVPAIHSIVSLSCGPNIAVAQVEYGACILSFLGGVRWGFAISPNESPNWLNLGFSVLPSLVAWMGLLMPIQHSLFCVISGLTLAGIIDSRFKSYPPWFRSLRFLLTTFAVLSLSVTFAFSILYPPPKPEHGYNFKKLMKIARIIVQD